VSPVTITIGSASPANVPLITPPLDFNLVHCLAVSGYNREVVASLMNEYGGTLWQCTGLGPGRPGYCHAGTKVR
jgi:hypothetical protein